jgi:hypothetical protein
MIIHYLNIESITVFETETQTPLIIYADAPLPLAVSVQSFQPVIWWNAKVFNRIRIIQHLQLTSGNRGKGLESAWAITFKYRLGVFAIEGFDHE